MTQNFGPEDGHDNNPNIIDHGKLIRIHFCKCLADKALLRTSRIGFGRRNMKILKSNVAIFENMKVIESSIKVHDTP